MGYRLGWLGSGKRESNAICVGGEFEVREQMKDLAVRLMQTDQLRSSADRLSAMARFVTWCATHQCHMVAERSHLHDLAIQTAGHDMPLTYLEFGVYQGESLRWWINQCTDPGARFIGFDTFSGLPEDWTPDRPKGHFDTGGQLPVVNDDRVSFERGMFQETLPTFLQHFERTGRIVAHLDADLYSSTLFVLVWLLPHLEPGDLLIFDEFHDYMDEYLALEHALRAFPVDLHAVVAMPGYANRGYSRVVTQVR